MFDIVIANGTVIDGSGAPGTRMDVGVSGDKIAAVGEPGLSGLRIIDAEGMVICPGFIDAHSHTDHTVFINPTCESKVTQGVTTEISGNCGGSAYPCQDPSEVSEFADAFAQAGVDGAWKNMGEFLSALDKLPMTINFATHIGQGSVRTAVIGYDDRPPSASELSKMVCMVEEALASGALGLSSGLIYPPSCYATTEELIELCRPLSHAGGIYASHIRDEGEDLLSAVEEAIRIGREAGAGVQISHHKVCGMKSWGNVRESLSMIDAARAEGLDVWADQYPYTATATGLGTMLPAWAHDGGLPALMHRLTDKTQLAHLRAKVLEDTENGWIDDWGGWKAIVISYVPKEKNRWCEGKNIQDIARQMGKHPVDAVLDLMREESGAVNILRFVIDEKDVSTVMKHPAVIIGSDATARAVSGPASNGKPHPRSFGTFPRVLGKYSRDEQVILLEEAIAKMTGRTAQRFNLPMRGLVKEGYFADLVIFDPQTIKDTATYSNPHAWADGIKHVLVNGQTVIEDNMLKPVAEAAPGRVLRRGML